MRFWLLSLYLFCFLNTPQKISIDGPMASSPDPITSTRTQQPQGPPVVPKGPQQDVQRLRLLPARPGAAGDGGHGQGRAALGLLGAYACCALRRMLGWYGCGFSVWLRSAPCKLFYTQTKIDARHTHQPSPPPPTNTQQSNPAAAPVALGEKAMSVGKLFALSFYPRSVQFSFSFSLSISRVWETAVGAGGSISAADPTHLTNQPQPHHHANRSSPFLLAAGGDKGLLALWDLHEVDAVTRRFDAANAAKARGSGFVGCICVCLAWACG